MQITNNLDISLTLAVWLLHDEYDYVNDPNYISVTTLMKPIRQIILPRRIPIEDQHADVSDYIARKLGHAIHDSIEKAWVNHERSLKLLGIPQHIVDRVKINPSDEEVKFHNGPDMIAVYLEQRGIREIAGKKIGGKFDMVAEGILQDNKSTSAYSWLFGTRDDEHRLQGSLYRWIDAGRDVPRITEDFMKVNYIFTDWSKAAARQNPKYPQKRVEEKILQLMSLEETERWIKARLELLSTWFNRPESEIPECTDEELWRSDPQYKYYSDPTKASDPTARSTRNFDTLAAARAYMAEKGGKGIVVTKLGEPKACGYCAAFDACTQKDRLGVVK